MSRHSEIITNGAVKVETYVDGDPDSRSCVVVLPSYGGDGGEDFDALAAALAAAGHRVPRPQPRGIANSTGPMDDVTMEDLADDVAHVIEKLGDAPAVVLGHAFGNLLARILRPTIPTRSPASSLQPPLVTPSILRSTRLRFERAI